MSKCRKTKADYNLQILIRKKINGVLLTIESPEWKEYGNGFFLLHSVRRYDKTILNQRFCFAGLFGSIFAIHNKIG